MTHSQCADAGERKIDARLKRDGVALTDFLHRDQRQVGEDLSILRFTTEFLVRAHHRENVSFVRRSLLQFDSVPLAYGVVDGFVACAAAKKIEGSHEELRIEVQRPHVSSVACLAKEPLA